jgi:hypothetical protein
MKQMQLCHDTRAKNSTKLFVNVCFKINFLGAKSQNGVETMSFSN